MSNIKKEAFALLEEWCDKLITLQLNIGREELDGGILCPACASIHGRCSDLIFPLMYLFSQTGAEKYRTAAISAFNFTEKNLLREDGTYYNDVNCSWRGTSVFSAISIGETLLRFGSFIDESIRREIEVVFMRLVKSSVRYFHNEVKTPNINYYAGLSAMLAIAYRYTQNGKYLHLANAYERKCRGAFDKEGFLFGEGKNKYQPSERGCSSIDMGYNLEESLPLLITHSVMLESEEKICLYTDRVIDHLDFVLPDGAIDNSFGTRMNKWTYYGSRTSDGMLGGLAVIADKNRKIARALLENFKLQKRCTHDGLLFGGPMQYAAEEPPCIHHTFTHAKALAEFCLNINPKIYDSDLDGVLSREVDGVRKYQDGNLYTVTSGDLIATVNNLDTSSIDESSSGGSISLLWHKKYGPILAATLHKYFPAEPHNMQYQRGSNTTVCMTPRFVSADGEYSSDIDRSVRLSSKRWCISAKSESFPLELSYTFSDNGVVILVRAKASGTFILPVICQREKDIRKEDNSVIFGEKLTVTASTLCNINLKRKKLHFNQVGGFRYAILEIPVSDAEETKIEIKIN